SRRHGRAPSRRHAPGARGAGRLPRELPPLVAGSLAAARRGRWSRAPGPPRGGRSPPFALPRPRPPGPPAAPFSPPGARRAMPARHRLARRRIVEVSDLVQETLLVLRPSFGSREWFDAACRVLHARPKILLESAAPHTLIALAREGHGIAVIPSTVRFTRTRVRPVP